MAGESAQCSIASYITSYIHTIGEDEASGPSIRCGMTSMLETENRTEILCPDKKRQKQVLHVNLMREFKEREVTSVTKPVMLVHVAEDGDEELDMEPVHPQGVAVELPEHLSKAQQAQLTQVQASFPLLFQERPGHTKTISHDIVLKDSTPIRQRPYRVPERMVEPLKKEVATMLDMGVIEASRSEWSSPVLLVPKKDGF